MQVPSPKFNLQFYQAWRAKGVFAESKQWSYWKPADDTPIVTVWHTSLDGGISEVVKDAETGRMLLMCPPGPWAKTTKGRQYIAMAAECITHDKPAEAILLVGCRGDDGEASTVYGAAISDDLYHVKFTCVDADGTIEGYFLTKDMK
jgi:hypothetical protein